jgi:hypothetical protein
MAFEDSRLLLSQPDSPPGGIPRSRQLEAGQEFEEESNDADDDY